MREIKFRAWDVTQQQYVSEYDTGDYSPVEFDSKGNATPEATRRRVAIL